MLNLENDPIIGDSVKKAVSEWTTNDRNDEKFQNTVKKHRIELRHRYQFILISIVAIIFMSGFSVTVGTTNVGFLDSYKILLDHITGNTNNTVLDFLVVDYRLPRVIVAIITGAGLAICGAVMQSVLKNPLADPYTTGVSSGAALGATLAMTTGMASYFGSLSLVVMAFLISMIPIGLIIMMSKISNASPTTMIMAGIGVMFLFNAFTTMMMLWADPMDLAKVYRWQVGSLAMVSGWNNVPVMMLIVVFGIVSMMLLSGKMNVLATGDDNAKVMGIDADRLRILILILAGVVSAGVVSFTGLIGFVGLVAPHIVRMFIGADNKYLIPASAAFGSLLLLTADTLGKSGIVGFTMQVGVVMAFIGGPAFLWLIFRRNSTMW